MLGWGCVTRMGVLENVEVLGYHISNIELVLMGRLYRSFERCIRALISRIPLQITPLGFLLGGSMRSFSWRKWGAIHRVQIVVKNNLPRYHNALSALVTRLGSPRAITVRKKNDVPRLRRISITRFAIESCLGKLRFTGEKKYIFMCCLLYVTICLPSFSWRISWASTSTALFVHSLYVLVS